MKTLLKTLILLSLSSISLMASAELSMVFTEKGYPYKNLVNRTESVKIFYTEKDHEVSCRVEVEVDGTNWKSAKQQVSKQAFSETPLASCLSRDRAKQILAATFGS